VSTKYKKNSLHHPQQNINIYPLFLEIKSSIPYFLDSTVDARMDNNPLFNNKKAKKSD